MDSLITQSRLNALLSEAVKEVKSAGLAVQAINPNVQIRNLKKIHGLCQKDKATDCCDISVSRYILHHRESVIKEVLVHEVLHAVEGSYHHDEKWKAACRAMNKKYGYHISRTAEIPHRGGNPIAIFKCKGCGCEHQVYRRNKFYQHPELYKCRKCGGAFTKTMPL